MTTPNGSTAAAAVKPPKTKRITSVDYLKKLKQLRYSFKLNEIDDRIEVNGIPISKTIRAEIRMKMRDVGFRRHLAAIEDTYLVEADRNSYHPIKDYLINLKWDGLDHIGNLASHFTDKDGVFERYLKSWLIGSIAKVFQQQQNTMLVIDGAQGIGKSFFAQWLGSALPDYFIESPINPADKDNSIRLMSKWLWEVAELGASFRRADREALKFFISQRNVTVRRPYDKDDTIKPAIASLIGTINNEAGFLSDPTGNRRFLVTELMAIDWQYTKLNVDDIWSQAYGEFKQGWQWQLSPKEQEKQNEINLQYRTPSIVLDLFLKCYAYNTNYADKQNTGFESTTDILQTLQVYGLNGSQKANSMELAAGLKELGIKKSRYNRTGPHGYFGVYKIV